MKRKPHRQKGEVRGFAAHAAGVADLETLLEFVKAYYEFDGIPSSAAKEPLIGSSLDHS